MDGEATNSRNFAVGQVWTYESRPGEEKSTAIVGAISVSALQELVVHVKVVGVHVGQAAHPWGIHSEITHIPIFAGCFAESVLVRSLGTPDLSGFQEGYEEWQHERTYGDAGIFDVSLSEAIGLIEKTILEGEPVD